MPAALLQVFIRVNNILWTFSEELVKTGYCNVTRIHHFSHKWFDFVWTTQISPVSSSDKGIVHKSVVFAGEVHIVEEIQLLKNSEPIKNLLLSSEVSSQAREATTAQKNPQKTRLCFVVINRCVNVFAVAWENSKGEVKSEVQEARRLAWRQLPESVDAAVSSALLDARAVVCSRLARLQTLFFDLLCVHTSPSHLLFNVQTCTSADTLPLRRCRLGRGPVAHSLLWKASILHRLSPG